MKTVRSYEAVRPACPDCPGSRDPAVVVEASAVSEAEGLVVDVEVVVAGLAEVDGVGSGQTNTSSSEGTAEPPSASDLSSNTCSAYLLECSTPCGSSGSGDEFLEGMWVGLDGLL